MKTVLDSTTGYVLWVIFIATLIYRYLAIAQDVPPPAARRR